MPDQVDQPRLRQRRDQPDVARLQRVEDDARVGRPIPAWRPILCRNRRAVAASPRGEHGVECPRPRRRRRRHVRIRHREALMTGNRRLRTVAAGVGAVRRPGPGPVGARRGGRGPRPRRRAGAALRGRSVLAQAAAQPLGARQRHRRLGGRPRQRLDRPPRLRHPGRQREGARAEGRRLLRRRARRARLRQGRQSDPALGWPRAGLRLARLEPRHLRRSHRHRVDRRQRPGRLAHHEVHPGRQVRRPVRQARTPG